MLFTPIELQAWSFQTMTSWMGLFLANQKKHILARVRFGAYVYRTEPIRVECRHNTWRVWTIIAWARICFLWFANNYANHYVIVWNIQFCSYRKRWLNDRVCMQLHSCSRIYGHPIVWSYIWATIKSCPHIQDFFNTCLCSLYLQRFSCDVWLYAHFIYMSTYVNVSYDTFVQDTVYSDSFFTRLLHLPSIRLNWTHYAINWITREMRI